MMSKTMICASLTSVEAIKTDDSWYNIMPSKAGLLRYFPLGQASQQAPTQEDTPKPPERLNKMKVYKTAKEVREERELKADETGRVLPADVEKNLFNYDYYKAFDEPKSVKPKKANEKKTVEVDSTPRIMQGVLGKSIFDRYVPSEVEFADQEQATPGFMQAALEGESVLNQYVPRALNFVEQEPVAPAIMPLPAGWFMGRPVSTGLPRVNPALVKADDEKEDYSSQFEEISDDDLTAIDYSEVKVAEISKQQTKLIKRESTTTIEDESGMALESEDATDSQPKLLKRARSQGVDEDSIVYSDLDLAKFVAKRSGSLAPLRECSGDHSNSLYERSGQRVTFTAPKSGILNRHHSVQTPAH